jgi:integrase
MARQDPRRGIAGSVSRRKDGRWLAQLPPSMGRRSKVHDDEDSGWLWLRQENAKATLDVGRDGKNPARVLVKDLIEVWLAAVLLKETTLIDYRKCIAAHVNSSPFGALTVGEVRGMDIDKLLQAAPKNWTRLHLSSILSTFFDWAENNRFTVGNPYRQSDAKRIGQITKRTLERRASSDIAWTPEQLVLFIAHEPCVVYRDYWIFVAATGARRGEAIGARWPNIHPAEGWGWLQDNVTTAANKTIYSDTPKNWKRRRTYFGPVVGQMLLARKKEQEKHKATCGTWSGDWVFDRRNGKGKTFHHGTHLSPGSVTNRFNRHTAELGLPSLAGPHGLRRTFATIAEAEGFNPSALTKALGHTPSLQNLYPKASESDMLRLAARLTELILPPD